MNKKRSLLVFLPMMLGLMVFLSGCVSFSTNSVRGVGDMVSRPIQTQDFNTLSISGNYIVVFRQSPNNAVTIEMQENLFEYLQVSVQNETLYIESDRNFNTSNTNRPRIYIYAPYLAGLDFAGAVEVTDWDTVYAEQFSINTAGAVVLTLTLEVDDLDVYVAGAGSLSLYGSANAINIVGSGALNISAGSLEINEGSVDISGVANVTLSTLNNIDVNSAGLARVRVAE